MLGNTEGFVIYKLNSYYFKTLYVPEKYFVVHEK